MYSKFETSDTVHLARECKSERIKNDEWINFFFNFPIYCLVQKMEKSLFGWKEKCKLYKFTFMFLVDIFFNEKNILLEKNKNQIVKVKRIKPNV